MNKLAEQLKLQDAYANAVSAISAQGYLDQLVIDSQPPGRLASKLDKDPWQRHLYDLLVPMFELATGHRPNIGQPRAFYCTAPKGHSKTSILAQLLNWALVYSKNPINCVAVAADKEQANILLQRMRAEASRNPYIKAKLGFNNYIVRGNGGNLVVRSSEIAGSAGLLSDVFICDEITWWEKKDLFCMLFAGRNKKPNSIFIIISNAGLVGTWQEELWSTAKNSADWITYEIPAFSASWLNRSAIENDQRLLLPSFYARLYLNQWINQEDYQTYVTRQQVQACIDTSLHYRHCQDTRKPHVLSIDYATVHDRCALAVMHPDGDKVILDQLEVIQGSHEARVAIQRVEDWIEECIRNFDVSGIVLDAWQMESTAQKYETRLPLTRINFGAQHQRLAENLRILIIDRRLRIYEGAGLLRLATGSNEDLVDELAKLVIEEKTSGKWRVNHLPGLHDDRYVAIAMGALGCCTMEVKPTIQCHVIGLDDPAPKQQGEFIFKDQFEQQDMIWENPRNW